MEAKLNVLGEPLAPCSEQPLTGFFRDGCCNTAPEDIGLHTVCTRVTAEFLEFSPAIAEWLGWKRARKILHRLTLGAVIFGITLSMLHQSGLGALFLMAKAKIHPLWYSEFIPILFFVSSIFAGLSMVIFEGSISHRVFNSRLSMEHQTSHPG